MARDFDLERIEAVGSGGLAEMRADDDEDIDLDTLALDTFLIVASFSYKNPDGEDREGTCVWSESRRRYIKLGLIEAGRERLDDLFDLTPDDE